MAESRDSRMTREMKLEELLREKGEQISQLGALILEMKEGGVKQNKLGQLRKMSRKRKMRHQLGVLRGKVEQLKTENKTLKIKGLEMKTVLEEAEDRHKKKEGAFTMAINVLEQVNQEEMRRLRKENEALAEKLEKMEEEHNKKDEELRVLERATLKKPELKHNAVSCEVDFLEDEFPVHDPNILIGFFYG